MNHAPLILSVGTQVVALVEILGPNGKPIHPRGAVGVITQSPADHLHSYRVRFPDAFEASLKRPEISVLAEYQSGEIGIATGASPRHPLVEHDLYDHVI